ncbi:hypothetical protein KM043_012239 [Ampulex compressa]|nr:hypothetical protein KM043_012239 [Ampulex compressa]
MSLTERRSGRTGGASRGRPPRRGAEAQVRVPRWPGGMKDEGWQGAKKWRKMATRSSLAKKGAAPAPAGESERFAGALSSRRRKESARMDRGRGGEERTRRPRPWRGGHGSKKGGEAKGWRGGGRGRRWKTSGNSRTRRSLLPRKVGCS